ncbi:MAG TPA: TIGR03088 family PEP-CTERM/XrtA system glycosyltransferase [Casimicrobiaceae bacterium]|nr:TIGR03088 family PEP-CTERM/XrtA system glycosyltransferase [Casimicrobiaceae bacterium]
MNRPPLVVHVVYRFGIGGLENGVVNLVNRLPRDRWRHAIVSLTDVDETFRARLQRDDVEVVGLGKSPGHAIPLYPALYRRFRTTAPAIVHTRNLAALEAVIPAWAAGVRCRVHGEHGWDALDPDGTHVRRQRIRRLYKRFVTRYVALSPDLARYLIEAIRVPPERVEQIVNGVDIERFRPGGSRRPIASCPFTDDKLRLVGTVGRLDAVKDQVNLAQAFVRAGASDPRVRERLRLVVVGEGPLKADVEAVLERAGMRELAWLPGARHDVPAILRGLDVFVLPSRAEGVSNTLLEAMASGLPIVATNVGANADLLVAGECGTIVPPMNSEALASAMLGYVLDPERARAHGDAARARAVARFSLERMIERYDRLYGQLVESQTHDGAMSALAQRQKQST